MHAAFLFYLIHFDLMLSGEAYEVLFEAVKSVKQLS